MLLTEITRRGVLAAAVMSAIPAKAMAQSKTPKWIKLRDNSLTEWFIDENSIVADGTDAYVWIKMQATPEKAIYFLQHVDFKNNTIRHLAQRDNPQDEPSMVRRNSVDLIWVRKNVPTDYTVEVADFVAAHLHLKDTAQRVQRAKELGASR